MMERIRKTLNDLVDDDDDGGSRQRGINEGSKGNMR